MVELASRRASSALWSLLSADRASASSHRCVQCHGTANQRLERRFINLVALMEIDATIGYKVSLQLARNLAQRLRGAILGRPRVEVL